MLLSPWKSSRRHPRRVCRLENRLVPHAWPVLKYRDPRAGLKVNVKRDTSWRADLHNYIHALHNAGYPAICRHCTCTVSPWNLFARSYVHRLYIRLSHACEVFSRGKGTATRESRGPRVQLYEAFSVPATFTERGWPLPSRGSLIAAFSLRDFSSTAKWPEERQLARYVQREI